MRKTDSRQVGGRAGGADASTDFAHDGIASKLKEFYGVLEDEGIPDNLVQLLEKLDAAEKAGAKVQNSKGTVDG
jgi:hypothetical protein